MDEKRLDKFDERITALEKNINDMRLVQSTTTIQFEYLKNSVENINNVVKEIKESLETLKNEPGRRAEEKIKSNFNFIIGILAVILGSVGTSLILKFLFRM